MREAGVVLGFRRWEAIVFGVAIVNFIVFVAVSIRLGGDALNGEAGNGHYWLGSHGAYTEVSRAVFAYSRIHAGSLFITHPLGLWAGYRASRRKRGRPSD